VPAAFHPILHSATVGHLATIDARGEPQVNPVWFLWDGDRLFLSVKANTGKYRNLRRDPNLALSCVDATNPHHYVEIRGKVTAFDLYLDLSFVNRLAQKYTGRDMDPTEHVLERYKLSIEVRSWTGQ
jgi:PPOX class probable F420-dependent enzyme